jgi:CubicO group peptidase (beta-lactamase class C family)
MHRRHLFWGLVLSATVAGCGSAEPPQSPAAGGAGGTGGAAGAGGVGGADGAGGAGGADEAGGAGGDATDPRFDPLIAAVESERIELGAPGVAVAVIEDGEVTFARGFGSKDPAQEVPVLPTTLFRIGSVNKMLTATAVLEQVAQGSVDLAAPVTEYVPDFHFSADATWAPSIHVHHLLTHTSAMSDYLTIDAPAPEREDAALEMFLTGEFAERDYLMAPPGAFYNYSNPNFYLAGLIAEEMAGKPYRQLMKEDVFDPLGMDRTFFLASEVLADGDYAIGKTTSPNVPSPVLPDTYENAWARPAGYASSSVLDLARFVKFLDGGNEDVLPKALSDEMQSPQVDTQEFLDMVHYGYGLQVTDGFFFGGPDQFYRMKIVMHGGDIPGFAADVIYVPSLRFGLVALANTDGAHFTKSLVTALTTLPALPAPSPPPDLTVDPAAFSAFEGVYQDDHDVGTVTVTKVGDNLEINVPALDAADIDYDPVLTPVVGNNLALAVQGTTLPVTFIADGSGVTRYLRTRVFVGARVEAPPPPMPILSSERRSRLLEAIRRAPAPLSERLARPASAFE